MKSPNNERDRVPVGLLLSPQEVSSMKFGLHQMYQFAKGVPWEFPNNLHKTIRCSPKMPTSFRC